MLEPGQGAAPRPRRRRLEQSTATSGTRSLTVRSAARRRRGRLAEESATSRGWRRRWSPAGAEPGDGGGASVGGPVEDGDEVSPAGSPSSAGRRRRAWSRVRTPAGRAASRPSVRARGDRAVAGVAEAEERASTLCAERLLNGLVRDRVEPLPDEVGQRPAPRSSSLRSVTTTSQPAGRLGWPHGGRAEPAGTSARSAHLTGRWSLVVRAGRTPIPRACSSCGGSAR